MNIAEPLTVLKSELLQKIVPEIVDLLVSALHEGTAVHKVEEGLWDLLLRTGHQAMQALFDSHGTGDLGATLTLPNGAAVDRLENCIRGSTCPSSADSTWSVWPMVRGKVRRLPSCLWITACNCLKAPFRICCRIGIKNWPSNRHSAR